MELTENYINRISVSQLKDYFPKGHKYACGKFKRTIGKDLEDPKRTGRFAVLDEQGNIIGEGTRLSLYFKNSI